MQVTSVGYEKLRLLNFYNLYYLYTIPYIFMEEQMKRFFLVLKLSCGRISYKSYTIQYNILNI